MTNLKSRYVDTGLSLTTSRAWEGFSNQFDLCDISEFEDSVKWAVADGLNWPHGTDRIVRYVTTSSIGMPVSPCKNWNIISAYQAALHEQDEDIRYLKAITKWQKHRLDYQAVYNAYLLEAIDETEFLEEADKFSSTYREVNPSEIISGIEKISKLVPFSLDLSDYADFFGVETETVRAAFASLSADLRPMNLKYSRLDDGNESHYE